MLTKRITALTILVSVIFINQVTLARELTRNVIVAQDAHVQFQHKDQGFNADAISLKDDGNNNATRQGFVKIDYSELDVTSSDVLSAKLWVYVQSITVNTGYLYLYSLTDDNWSEEAITWDTKPTEGNSYIDNNNLLTTAEKWYSFDITSFIKEQADVDKIASFRLAYQQGKDLIRIASKEAADPSLRPYMEIKFNAPDIPDSQIVAQDKEDLTLDYDGYAETIMLPTQGQNGSTISWGSDNQSVINAGNGAVQRTSTDVTVTLTATITSGTEEDTKTFSILVKKVDTYITKVFPITQDTYTHNASAGVNMGASKTLVLKDAGGDNSTTRRGYIQADFTELRTSLITQAKLHFYVESAEITPMALLLYKLGNNAWDENSITWNNTPGSATYIFNTELSESNKWYEIDVTQYVQNNLGEKVISFMLNAEFGKGLLSISSSEAEENRPYLEITAREDSPYIGFENEIGQAVYSFDEAAKITVISQNSKPFAIAIYSDDGAMLVAEMASATGELAIPPNGTSYQLHIFDNIVNHRPYGHAIPVAKYWGTGIDNTVAEVKAGGIVEISGRIKKNTLEKSAGKNVLATVSNPNYVINELNYKDSLNFIGGIRTSDDGSYKIEYKLADDAQTGTYEVKINSNCLLEPIETAFHYTNPIKEAEAISGIIGANDIEEIKQVFLVYKTDLGLNYPLFDTISDQDFIFNGLLEATNLNSIRKIQDVFKAYTVVCAVNESDDNQEIEDLIDNYGEDLGLNQERYDMYNKDGFDKARIITLINQYVFETPEELITSFEDNVFLSTFNKITSWGQVYSLLWDNNDILEITFDKYNSLKNKLNVDKDMCSYAIKSAFEDKQEVVNKFYEFVDKQHIAENTPLGGGGSGGGGGGTSGGGGGTSGGGGSGLVTQQIVSSPSALTTTPTPAPVMRPIYSDLQGFKWAEEYILELTNKGVLQGTNGLFRPSEMVTREQFIKMLVEGFNLTDENASCTFNDVAPDQWFYKYVATAQKLGLSTGNPEGGFGAGQDIKREDMAVLSYRFAQFMSLNLDIEAERVAFTDSDRISEYAKEAVTAMQRAGIINGFPTMEFGPFDNANRAQAATIVYKLLKLEAN